MVLFKEDFSNMQAGETPDTLYCRTAKENAWIKMVEENEKKYLSIYDGGNDYLTPQSFMPSTFCECFFERQYGKMTATFEILTDEKTREDFGMCISLRGYDRNHAISIEVKKNKIVQRIGNTNHWLQEKEVVLADNVLPNKCYTIKLNIDVEAKTFDFYLDGKISKENVTFWKMVDNISSLVIAGGRKDPRVERYINIGLIEIESIKNDEPSKPFLYANRKKGKAPYKVLYGNDLTNAGIQWFKRPEEYFEALKTTVTELRGTGVDACLFQPYMASVPLWPSKFYPPLEHIKWWRETFKTDVGNILKYVEKGHDIIEEYINWCREGEVAPFISVRLNDGHHLDKMRDPDNYQPDSNVGQVVNKFYVDHPEWVLGSVEEKHIWTRHVFNWKYEGPRQIKLEFIKELTEYDIEGIELDFMRLNSYYRCDELNYDEMIDITTGFVKNVREILNEAANKREGKKKIWLCARIPADYEIMPLLGISIPKLVEAGVDMLNVSSYYHTSNVENLDKIVKEADGVSLYREGCHTIGVADNGGFDTGNFKRTTPLQFYTNAHLAYRAGFDGYSTFNFAYYRGVGPITRGPSNEPPFFINKYIADKEWIAKQPQHYFLADGADYSGHNQHSKRPQLKRCIDVGQFVGFEMQMAAAFGGWENDGKLRIECKQSVLGEKYRAWFNDVELLPTDDKTEFVSEYNGGFGQPQNYKAWIVPKELMRDGVNYIGVKLDDGKENQIVFIDLQIDKI